MSDPLISVVIPTRGRPLLVTRAVHSALRQTFDRFEVIVVIDGPDEATRDALRVLADPRLRVIQLGSNGGACAARNRGAEAARGEWIALLDDDDEWLPDKLDAQMQLARSSVYPEPVVAARSIVRTPRGEFVLPRRLPRRGEPVGDYMFIRHGLFHGDRIRPDVNDPGASGAVAPNPLRRAARTVARDGLDHPMWGNQRVRARSRVRAAGHLARR